MWITVISLESSEAIPSAFLVALPQLATGKITIGGLVAVKLMGSLDASSLPTRAYWRWIAFIIKTRAGISRNVIQAPSTNLAMSTTQTVINVAIAPRPFTNML